MLTKERRSAIAVLVSERGAVDVKELTTRFGETNETVRKDMIALEQERLFERTQPPPPVLSVMAMWWRSTLEVRPCCWPNA